jgi:hypothetical protein
MLSAHLMVNCSIILIFDLFNRHAVFIIRRLCIQSREHYSMAADYGFTSREDHISAYRAYMEFHTQHIERSVRIHNVFAGHQFDHGNTQWAAENHNSRL